VPRAAVHDRPRHVDGRAGGGEIRSGGHGAEATCSPRKPRPELMPANQARVLTPCEPPLNRWAQ
jgi:hypothetical protein